MAYREQTFLEIVIEELMTIFFMFLIAKSFKLLFYTIGKAMDALVFIIIFIFKILSKMMRRPSVEMEPING